MPQEREREKNSLCGSPIKIGLPVCLNTSNNLGVDDWSVQSLTLEVNKIKVLPLTTEVPDHVYVLG